jgi:hypothetical protein
VNIFMFIRNDVSTANVISVVQSFTTEEIIIPRHVATDPQNSVFFFFFFWGGGDFENIK